MLTLRISVLKYDFTPQPIVLEKGKLDFYTKELIPKIDGMVYIET